MRQGKIDQVSAKIAAEYPFIKRIFSASALSNVHIDSVYVCFSSSLVPPFPF